MAKFKVGQVVLVRSMAGQWTGWEERTILQTGIPVDKDFKHAFDGVVSRWDNPSKLPGPFYALEGSDRVTAEQNIKELPSGSEPSTWQDCVFTPSHIQVSA